MKENKIAIVSPSNNAYSETFIQVQKNGLKGKVFFYFDGELPKSLEGQGKLLNGKLSKLFKLKRKLNLTKFNLNEQAFIHSLKKNKVQVILAQYGTTSHRIVSISSFLKIPLITHFHGFDSSIDEVISKCNSYYEVFRGSSKVIVVSKEMEKKLFDLGCPKEKLVYNPCAPKKEFDLITPKFSKTQFLAVGRFANKKAPYYSILAFHKVVEKYPDAKLIMAGEGALLNTCKNLVKYLSLEKNVSFLGVITTEEYINLLNESLAFIQHSIKANNGDMEGTPVSILEASSAGLPIISTYHAGIPDVVIHNETGFLCNEHDISKMSKYMFEVLENKDLAIKLGSNGKSRIKKYFNLENHLTIIDDIIEKLIETHG